MIEEQEFHHLAHVSRVRQGETIEIVNGAGQLAEAEVVELQKRRARLRISSLKEEPPSDSKKILVQAIVRPQRLDLILEKGTELGLDVLLLFPGERSERKGNMENLPGQLLPTAISALKQSGRLYLPEIRLVPPLSKWESFPQEGAYFGDVTPGADSLARFLPGPPQKYFFVGPESGFSDGEIELLRKNHVQGVSLGKYILRAETAAIAALAVLSAI